MCSSKDLSPLKALGSGFFPSVFSHKMHKNLIFLAPRHYLWKEDQRFRNPQAFHVQRLDEGQT